jgi:alpha-D-xyloside xylohydrolase
MTGMPYWCTDIGGYWQQTDAETMTRWFEFGTFCPIFRVHGSADKEPWRYGAQAQTTLTNYINLRYRLMPYIYSLAWKVTSEGYTMMRGLLMDFKNDVTARNSINQFMFGPALLINPITDMGATSRQVYLPAGKWTDFWTGSATNGGTTVTAAAPLQTIPIYVPAGSILPMGPALQYATEKPADTIELRVFPGADGSFTLYEDENDNYNYEKGQYAKIPFTWNNAAQTLRIGARQGTFPGMLDKRVFNVVVVSPNHGSGQGFTATPDARVAYDGTAVSVKNGQISGALRSKSNQLVHFASLTRKVLHIVASNEDSWKMRVCDLQGRNIYSMENKGPKTLMLHQALSKGMYMLSVQFLNDKTATRQKFVIQ